MNYPLLIDANNKAIYMVQIIWSELPVQSAVSEKMWRIRAYLLGESNALLASVETGTAYEFSWTLVTA